VEGVADDSPAFADAQAEQELWGELRSHGATLDRALNEALRVHGGPTLRIFQVGRHCSFSSSSRFRALFLCRDAYGFRVVGDRSSSAVPATSTGPSIGVNTELHQVRERCIAFDALADALRTPDGWLAYRAMVLRDELPESTRQDPACRSSLERICTALIDRDEALWQARSDLEKMWTLATN
jgi:hypothetical protein